MLIHFLHYYSLAFRHLIDYNTVQPSQQNSLITRLYSNICRNICVYNLKQQGRSFHSARDSSRSQIQTYSDPVQLQLRGSLNI